MGALSLLALILPFFGTVKPFNPGPVGPAPGEETEDIKPRFDSDDPEDPGPCPWLLTPMERPNPPPVASRLSSNLCLFAPSLPETGGGLQDPSSYRSISIDIDVDSDPGEGEEARGVDDVDDLSVRPEMDIPFCWW